METKEVKVLKKLDVKALREELSSGYCPLLNVKMKDKATSPALDHDHDSGLVRGVISMCSNTTLGRIEKAYTKWCSRHSNVTFLEFLENVVAYLQQEQLPYQHPEHRDKHKRKVRRWKDTTLIGKIQRAGGEVPEGLARRHLVDLYIDTCILNEEKK